MAWDFTDINTNLANTQDTGVAVATFKLKERLKANGWTHVGSGDGVSNFSTTLGNGNDVITGSGSGANGIYNNGAWFIVRKPATGSAPYNLVFDLLFQFPAPGSNYTIRFAISISGFTAAGASATQTMDATDKQYIRGGGTPASPTYEQVFGYAGAGPMQLVVGGSAENHSFILAAYGAGSGNVSSLIFMDGLKSGSFPYGGGAGSQEPFPFVFGATSAAYLVSPQNVERWATYYRQGEGNELWKKTTVRFADWGGGGLTVSENMWSGNDESWPVIYYTPTSDASPNGRKGTSTLFKWAVRRRAYLDKGSDGATGNLLKIGDVFMPWNDAVPAS